MTEKQIEIADRLLLMLIEHEGHANKTGIRGMLPREFTNREDKIDITYVQDLLTDD